MPMKKRTWLVCFGAVLLMSAVPAMSVAQTRASSQSTAKKKTATSSKSKSKRTPKPKSQMAPTADRVREIQSALQQKGAYQGDPTGKWDDATVTAMKTFQDKNSLSPTGKIDALTLEKLGLGSETAGKGAPVPATSTIGPPPRSSQ